MISGPTSGRSVSRGSVRRTATTSCRRLSRFSGRSQPGALMKSEMTKTSERRLMAWCPVSSSGARSVSGALVSRGWRIRASMRRSTWRRPPRAGMVRSTLAAVEDGTHAIAPARQQAGQRGHEVDQHAALLALRLHAAEVHRRAEVQQEPGRDLAVLEVLAHVRRVHARRDVPVDVAHVVAGLVLAQVREVHAVAVEQRAVVALEQAVQPADDRPVEALEQLLRR